MHAANLRQSLAFLAIPDTWCIAPKSVYDHSPNQNDLACYNLREKAPGTLCCEIINTKVSPTACGRLKPSAPT